MAFNKTKYKKNKFIEAMKKSLGVVTTACNAVDIDRSTYYKWLEADPDFKKRVEEIDDVALDFSESHLFKQIQKGDTTAIIFHLKTKGKKRGYVEKVQQDISVTAPQIIVTDEAKKAIDNIIID